MDDEHFYSIFATYRFTNSIRWNKYYEKNINNLRDSKLLNSNVDNNIPSFMEPLMNTNTKSIDKGNGSESEEEGENKTFEDWKK